jgi:NitT/TauT family transport system ATP-binding protein
VSSASPVIAFDQVSKSFPGEGKSSFHAVRDLSFTVAQGERLAILGKTGCGKSTMFNLLAGIIQPSAGHVSVEGHDPYRDFAWFRGKIGIVFQSDRLMPWRSAIENAGLGLELNRLGIAERHAVAHRWLQRLGLGGHEQDFPHALSGGMRQRVSIARAFAIKPEILLCDEPFSALDEVTSQGLRDEFLELVQETKATCIFITHSIDEALYLGQRILVFQRPARIAFEARLGPGITAADRTAIRAGILQALGNSSPEQEGPVS